MISYIPSLLNNFILCFIFYCFFIFLNHIFILELNNSIRRRKIQYSFFIYASGKNIFFAFFWKNCIIFFNNHILLSFIHSANFL